MTTGNSQQAERAGAVRPQEEPRRGRADSESEGRTQASQSLFDKGSH